MNETTTQLKSRVWLVVVELGEGEASWHEELGEVDDDGGVLRVSVVGGVYHPAAVDGNWELAGEVGSLDDSTVCNQHAATLLRALPLVGT